MPDDHFQGSEAASSGKLLCSNNELNRLNCSMDHHNLINICLFEQSEALSFSDLSSPLSHIFNSSIDLLTLFIF